MSSFISNSSDRLPHGHWARTWLLAGVLIVLCSGAWEIFWRMAGFKPMVSDSAGLWAIERRKVKGFDPQQVVLIGASRINVDVDLDVFAKYLNGNKPLQLSILQSSFAPVLENLADDTSFNGIVICEGNEYLLLLEHKNLSRLSNEYVTFFKNLRLVDIVDQYLDMGLQKALVLFLPELNPLNLVRDVGQLKWPVQHVFTGEDRSRKVDYSLIDIQEYRKNVIKSQIGYYPPFDDIDKTFILNIQQIENSIIKIQKRGGRVIIVRFPTSGPVLKIDKRYMPREKYWDYWAAHTSAVVIHFEDYPSLNRFQCADYIHLAYRDSPVFTRELAIIIKEKIETQGLAKP
jgi:hypothetical protein